MRNVTRFNVIRYWLAGVGCGLMVLGASRAGAATLTVTSAADDSGGGTLRNTILGAQDGDTVNFDPSLNGQIITLSHGDIVIQHSIKVQGPGLLNLALTANQSSRIFTVTTNLSGPVVVTISGLTMEWGSGITTNNSIFQGYGGNILNNCSYLTLSQCQIQFGYADNGAGVCDQSGIMTYQNDTFYGNNASGEGGGVYASGGVNGNGVTTYVFEVYTNTMLVNNNAGNAAAGQGGVGAGGGVYGSGFFWVYNSTIAYNTSEGFGAGAQWTNSIVVVDESTIAGNQVTNGTPLIAIYSPGFNLGFGGGGGMACFNSTVAMDDDTIVYNGTVAEGGGLMLMGGQYYMTNTIVAMDAGLAGSPDLYSPEDDIGFTLIEFGNNYGTTYYTGTPTTVVSGGYNFIGSTNAPLIINYPNAYPGTVGTNNVAFYVFTNHDQVGTVAAPLNPNLGLLYPYGGPTWTMQPQTGSPVIAAGNPVAHANYDQRGAPYERVFNGHIDVGAYQTQPAPVLPTFTVAGLTNLPTDAAYNLFTATGVAPTGGSFSGPGVTTNYFHPAVAGLGSYTLTYSYTDTYSRLCASSLPVVVQIPNSQKTAQTITFTALTNQTYGNPPFTLAATASSGLPVRYAIISGPAAVSGNKLKIQGAGTVTVAALQPGNGEYLPANAVDQTFTVGLETQTINFYNGGYNTSNGVAPLTLGANASSGLPVTFNVISGPGYIGQPALQEYYTELQYIQQEAEQGYGDDESQYLEPPYNPGYGIYITGAGQVMVTASQGGNGNYSAAPTVTNTFMVSQGTQTISLSLQSVLYLYTTNASMGLPTSSSAGLPVTCQITQGPGMIKKGQYIAQGARTVTIHATQGGDSNWLPAPSVDATFTVTGVPQAISFSLGTYYYNPVQPGSYNITNSLVTASYPGGYLSAAPSGLPLTNWVVLGPATVSGYRLTPTGTGVVTVAAAQLGNGIYAPVTNIQTTTILPSQDQTINFPAIPKHTYGDAPIVLTLQSSAGLPVNCTVSGPATLSVQSAYSYLDFNNHFATVQVPSKGTVTLTGAGTVQLYETQPGNAQYNAAAPVSQSFTVNTESQTMPDIPVSEVKMGGPRGSC